MERGFPNVQLGPLNPKQGWTKQYSLSNLHCPTRNPVQFMQCTGLATWFVSFRPDVWVNGSFCPEDTAFQFCCISRNLGSCEMVLDGDDDTFLNLMVMLHDTRTGTCALLIQGPGLWTLQKETPWACIHEEKRGNKCDIHTSRLGRRQYQARNPLEWKVSWDLVWA